MRICEELLSGKLVRDMGFSFPDIRDDERAEVSALNG